VRCDHASRLRLVDVPLPHDRVGDLLPLGLLSHTLCSCCSCHPQSVPRPRVQMRVDLRNPSRPPCRSITDPLPPSLRSAPRPQAAAAWQQNTPQTPKTPSSASVCQILDTDGFSWPSIVPRGCHGADKALRRSGSRAFHSLAASAHALRSTQAAWRV